MSPATGSAGLRASIIAAVLTALALGAGTALPASADAAINGTVIQLSGPAAKQLTRAGVKVTATGAAKRRGKRVTLPTRKADYARKAGEIVHRGALRLSKGRRSVVLRAPRTVIGARSSLTVKLNGKRITLVTIAAGARRRSVSFQGLSLAASPARLSPAAARMLRTRLGLRRLKPGRLATVRARASIPVSGMSLTGGHLSWGFAEGVRTLFPAYDPAVETSFNTNHPNDHMREYFAGASLAADDTFRFPITGGTFDPGTGKAVVETRGWLRLGYCIGAFKAESGDNRTACPSADGVAHGIWLNMSDLTVRIDGSTGTFEGLTDAGFHGRPPILRSNRVFGKLDLTAAAPIVSSDGDTVTWTGIRAFLTAAGEPLGLGLPAYREGFELDPLTLTATIGR